MVIGLGEWRCLTAEPTQDRSAGWPRARIGWGWKLACCALGRQQAGCDSKMLAPGSMAYLDSGTLDVRGGDRFRRCRGSWRYSVKQSRNLTGMQAVAHLTRTADGSPPMLHTSDGNVGVFVNPVGRELLGSKGSTTPREFLKLTCWCRG